MKIPEIIKSAFNFILTFQLVALFIFIMFFIENDLFVTIPISIFISNDFKFSFNMDFTFGSMLGFLIAISIILILAGIQAVGSGLNDTALANLRKIITIVGLSTILSIPVFYLFGKSDYLIDYASVVNFVCFIFYTLYFLSAGGNE